MTTSTGCIVCGNIVEHADYPLLCNACEVKELARGNRMTRAALVTLQQQRRDGIAVLADTWDRVLATAIDALDEVEELDGLIQEWKAEVEQLQLQLVSEERP